MKSFLCFIAVTISCHICVAQSFSWAQRLGNIKSDKITSVKTDGLGYIYIAGYFSTSITLGTNAVQLQFVGSTNSKEAFIAKLDSTGFCLWAKAGGAYFDDRVLGMDVDSAGNSVITGTFWEGSGISFPPINITGAGFGGGDQCFILKLDPNGVPLWGRFVSGQGDDQGLDVAIDRAGNIYTVGFMSSTTLYCGGNALTATNPNIGAHKHCYWLTKMNSNGVFQWVKTYGNLPWDPAAFKYIERDIAVCVDEKDGIYITGGFDSTRQFGTSSFTSGGGYDCFVMKYDSLGNFKWATQAGSSKDDWSNGICSDKNGNIYVTGEHRDSLYMDTVLVRNYDKRDVFIFKLDAQTGKPYWGKRAGSNLGDERGNDVWADGNCNVYVCGDINEGAKFGDNIIIPSTGLEVQSFVARITPEGKWSWVATGGGPGEDDRANAVAKGKGNQLYVAGFFRTSATFGSSSLASTGSSDGFIVRLHDSLLNKGTAFELDTPNKTVLCFGDTAHLRIPKHAYFQIDPVSGVQFNQDSTGLVFSPTVTTTYTMSGFTSGACGEYDTLTFTISVGLEAFSLSKPEDTSICRGESIDMVILPHDHFDVNPKVGSKLNSGESLLTFSPSVTTTYVLTGYKNQTTCPTYDTQAITIVVNQHPFANFEVTPDVVFVDEPTFVLRNNSTGANSFKWFRRVNELFSNDPSTSVTESEVGTFCYTLVAESSAGCVDSTTECGDVIRRERVFFPGAFTPNGDHRNDEFKPVLVNIDMRAVSGFSLVIANRYGEIMYKSFDPSEGWDGTWRGGKCELGTYYYICQFVTPQGKVYNVKGDVALIY